MNGVPPLFCQSNVAPGWSNEKVSAPDDFIAQLYELPQASIEKSPITLNVVSFFQDNFHSLAAATDNYSLRMPECQQEALVVLIMCIRSEHGLPLDTPISRREIRAALSMVKKSEDCFVNAAITQYEKKDPVLLLADGIKRYNINQGVPGDHTLGPMEYELVRSIYDLAHCPETSKQARYSAMLDFIIANFDDLAYIEQTELLHMSGALQEMLVVIMMDYKECSEPSMISADDVKQVLIDLINHAISQKAHAAKNTLIAYRESGVANPLAQGMKRYQGFSTPADGSVLPIDKYLVFRSSLAWALTCKANLTVWNNKGQEVKGQEIWKNGLNDAGQKELQRRIPQLGNESIDKNSTAKELFA